MAKSNGALQGRMAAALDVAVLLLGHGSRAKEANEGMYRILDILRRQGQYRIVEAGFMGLNPPTIEEGAAACIAQGARAVMMVPYFLHTGIHIQQDLPRVMQRLQSRYPEARFVLAEPLGFHPKLVDVVRERIDGCWTAISGNGKRSGQTAEDDSWTRARPASLRKGYTTGACAAAATKAAARALLTQESVNQVELRLPMGDLAVFQVARCEVSPDSVRCTVIKDGGDDPDATHGAEIQSSVAWDKAARIAIMGGQGVGVITKPGLELPVGEPAINPVPRQMIRAAVTEALGEVLRERSVKVVISVPRGEEIARKTLNRRLGIVGGISILGTTGIVVPFSNEAYTASIALSLGVAVACGCKEVVLTTGRRSERFAQALMELPEEAFVQMGDCAGFALEECVRRGLQRVTIFVMIGKLSKLAAGHLQTHVSKSSLSHSFLASIAADFGASPEVVREIAEANTGRHFAEIAREARLTGVFQRLCQLAAENSRAHVAERLDVTCVLTDFDGTVVSRASVEG